MEGKEKLTSKAVELFNRTNYEVLWAVGSTQEFFTTENFAQNACKNGEKPIKFTRQALPASFHPNVAIAENKEHLNNVKTQVKKRVKQDEK